MKYGQKSFSVALSSEAYRENYDRISFKKKRSGDDSDRSTGSRSSGRRRSLGRKPGQGRSQKLSKR